MVERRRLLKILPFLPIWPRPWGPRVVRLKKKSIKVHYISEMLHNNCNRSPAWLRWLIKVNDCYTGLTTNWIGKVYIGTCKRISQKNLSKILNHVHFFFQMKVPSLLMTLGLVTVLFCGCVVVQASSQCLSVCVNSYCRQECLTSGHAYGTCRRKYNCPSSKPKVCQCVL